MHGKALLAAKNPSNGMAWHGEHACGAGQDLSLPCVQSFAGVIVCGHSYGGPMALQLASRHPKQIHGLIILGCRTYPQTEVQRARSVPAGLT